eukprot:365674-Chlamydomonas_euryale.AAC.13
MQVKRYDGNVEDLGLTFNVDDDFFGSKRSYELLPGWGDVPVTNDNRLLYCHLLADWHLNVRLGRAADAFARGVAHIIPPGAFRLFNPRELNELISGGGDEGLGGADIDDLRAHTRYSGGYHEDSTAVKLFWKVALEMSGREMALLLRFVTSCSRPPLGGFKVCVYATQGVGKEWLHARMHACIADRVGRTRACVCVCVRGDACARPGTRACVCVCVRGDACARPGTRLVGNSDANSVACTRWVSGLAERTPALGCVLHSFSSMAAQTLCQLAAAIMPAMSRPAMTSRHSGIVPHPPSTPPMISRLWDLLPNGVALSMP